MAFFGFGKKKSRPDRSFRTEKPSFEERANKNGFFEEKTEKTEVQSGVFKKDPEEEAMDAHINAQEKEIEQKAKNYGQ